VAIKFCHHTSIILFVLFVMGSARVLRYILRSRVSHVFVLPNFLSSFVFSSAHNVFFTRLFLPARKKNDDDKLEHCCLLTLTYDSPPFSYVFILECPFRPFYYYSRNKKNKALNLSLVVKCLYHNNTISYFDIEQLVGGSH
jgi:hypothetical protein